MRAWVHGEQHFGRSQIDLTPALRYSDDGENQTMSGIQFVTDEKGRRVAVQIDLRKHQALWDELSDGLVSERRRAEKGIPYEEYRSGRMKRRRAHG